MSQTIFPGIEVTSLDIVKGVIKGDGSLGTAEGFGEVVGQEDLLQNNVITKTVRKLYKENLGERDALTYTLRVKATNEASAKTKARAYVRLKNPFEPSALAIASSEKIRNNNLVKTYLIAVPVMKSGLLGDIG